MNIIKKIVNTLASHLEEFIMVVLLVYMSACMFVQVFMRHVMHNSLSWSEESIRFAFVWLVFIGFGLAVKEKRHISINFLKDLMKPKVQLIMSAFSNLVFLVYSAFMLYYGTRVIIAFIQSAQRSPALGIPMWIIYLAAPVGFLLTIIRLVKASVENINQIVKSEKQIGG